MDRAVAPAHRRAVRLRLHAALPVAILALPLWWGAPWRDLLAFAPDAALVLVLCAALLAVAGAAKLAAAALARNAAPQANMR